MRGVRVKWKQDIFSSHHGQEHEQREVPYFSRNFCSRQSANINYIGNRMDRSGENFREKKMLAMFCGWKKPQDHRL